MAIKLTPEMRKALKVRDKKEEELRKLIEYIASLDTSVLREDAVRILEKKGFNIEL